jgi:RNA polymerase sigma-70 factor, ECF subfamily
MNPRPCKLVSSRDFELQAITHIPALRQMALRLCRDADRAADLVQDTLERALYHQDRFIEGTQLEAWLRTIMRNIFRDGWRRASARSELLFNIEPEAPPPHDLGEEARWRLISDDQLQAALAQLPEPLRITFEIHTAERLRYAALAQRLGISPSTAGTRLLRARRKLREMLMPLVAAQGDPITDGEARSRRPGSPRGSRPPGSSPDARWTRARRDPGCAAP